MDIDAAIGECGELADDYIEAMKGQGTAQAHGLTSSPQHWAAKVAFDRLLMKSHLLEDLGRSDLAARIMDGAVRGGEANAKAAIKEELGKLSKAVVV